MPAGSTITFAAFAGIGTPSGNHAASTSCGQNLMIEYYNGASLIRRDVSSNITNNIYSGAGPGFLPYSVTGIIPSNATSIRIGGEADCQFLKFDGACLQVECTNVAKLAHSLQALAHILLQQERQHPLLNMFF